MNNNLVSRTPAVRNRNPEAPPPAGDWRTRHLCLRYNVTLPLASAIAALTFNIGGQA